ncbi:hypothetical protein HIM_05318 [Hirsutella minnesotensis 3608]|uniref:AB hydrolase-1 domain-containing protein n=1 Tax=Hirsutella minnesotensis 3608 TaxID=1043627 RepID=A0A0F8A0J6_9HYPO|nr:hypothetical protein HIM_05318 [Hirsutella minnesotensis 3608]
MIGTSAGEWLFIRASIALIRYTPLLYAAILAALCIRRHTAAASFVAALLAAEALFYLCVFRPHVARVRTPANHPPALSPVARRTLFYRCMGNVPDADEYLRWWFLGADRDDIRRDNVAEFLLWAFFDTTEADARRSPDHDAIRAELDEYLDFVDKRLREPLAPGRGPARGLMLTLDHVETAYRSMSWYLAVLVVDQLTHLIMSALGFHYYARARHQAAKTVPPRPQELWARRRSPAPSLSYWYCPHEAGSGQLPVVFFHGIGIGLWPYTRLLANLRTAKMRNDTRRGRGVIAIEMLSVSNRLTPPPLDKARFLEEMSLILNSHREWHRFTVVSHSYGSVLTSHLLLSSELGHRVPSVVLVDPVTVLLHLPDVAFNFTRKRPRRANEWQLWFFGSSDPGVAHTLGRHFFWRQNIIWKEELLSIGGDKSKPRKVAVSLGGRDLLVDAATVARYLKGDARPSEKAAVDCVVDVSVLQVGVVGDIEVMLSPDLDHADILHSKAERKRLEDIVGMYCDIRA